MNSQEEDAEAESTFATGVELVKNLPRAASRLAYGFVVGIACGWASKALEHGADTYLPAMASNLIRFGEGSAVARMILNPDAIPALGDAHVTKFIGYVAGRGLAPALASRLFSLISPASLSLSSEELSTTFIEILKESTPTVEKILNAAFAMKLGAFSSGFLVSIYAMHKEQLIKNKQELEKAGKFSPPTDSQIHTQFAQLATNYLRHIQAQILQCVAVIENISLSDTNSLIDDNFERAFKKWEKEIFTAAAEGNYEKMRAPYQRLIKAANTALAKQSKPSFPNHVLKFSEFLQRQNSPVVLSIWYRNPLYIATKEFAALVSEGEAIHTELRHMERRGAIARITQAIYSPEKSALYKRLNEIGIEFSKVSASVGPIQNRRILNDAEEYFSGRSILTAIAKTKNQNEDDLQWEPTRTNHIYKNFQIVMRNDNVICLIEQTDDINSDTEEETKPIIITLNANKIKPGVNISSLSTGAKAYLHLDQVGNCTVSTEPMSSAQLWKAAIHHMDELYVTRVEVEKWAEDKIEELKKNNSNTSSSNNSDSEQRFKQYSAFIYDMRSTYKNLMDKFEENLAVLERLYSQMDSSKKRKNKTDYDKRLLEGKVQFSGLRKRWLKINEDFISEQQGILNNIKKHIPATAPQNTAPGIKENFLSRFDLFFDAVCSEGIPMVLANKPNTTRDALEKKFNVVALQDLAFKLRQQNLITLIKAENFTAAAQETDIITGYQRNILKHFEPTEKRQQENRHFETLAAIFHLQKVIKKIDSIDMSSLNAETSQRIEKIRQTIQTTLSTLERSFGKFEVSPNGEIQISPQVISDQERHVILDTLNQHYGTQLSRECSSLCLTTTDVAAQQILTEITIGVEAIRTRFYKDLTKSGQDISIPITTRANILENHGLIELADSTVLSALTATEKVNRQLIPDAHENLEEYEQAELESSKELPLEDGKEEQNISAEEKQRLKKEAKLKRRKEKREAAESAQLSTELSIDNSAHISQSPLTTKLQTPGKENIPHESVSIETLGRSTIQEKQVKTTESPARTFEQCEQEMERLKLNIKKQREELDKIREKLPASPEHLSSNDVVGVKEPPSKWAEEAANKALSAANDCESLVRTNHEMAMLRSAKISYLEIRAYREQKATLRQEAIDHFELSEQLAIKEKGIHLADTPNASNWRALKPYASTEIVDMTSKHLGTEEAHFSHFKPGTNIPIHKHIAQTTITFKDGTKIRRNAHYDLPFPTLVPYEKLVTQYKGARGFTSFKKEGQWFLPAGSGAHHGRINPADDDGIIRMQAVFDILKDRRFNLDQPTQDALRASLSDDEKLKQIYPIITILRNENIHVDETAIKMLVEALDPKKAIRAELANHLQKLVESHLQLTPAAAIPTSASGKVKGKQVAASEQNAKAGFVLESWSMKGEQPDIYHGVIISGDNNSPFFIVDPLAGMPGGAPHKNTGNKPYLLFEKPSKDIDIKEGQKIEFNKGKLKIDGKEIPMGSSPAASQDAAQSTQKVRSRKT